MYTLVRDVKVINIVVVSKRDENYCYETAAKRKKRYGYNLYKNIID